MGKIIINQSLVTKEIADELIELCPFKAIEYKDDKLELNAGCKTCKLCVKKGPAGVMQYEEDKVSINKDEWIGISVFMEQELDHIHPVSFELIGKAKELASVINHPVYAIIVASSSKANEFAKEAIEYGADKAYVYASEELAEFNCERYANCLIDFVNKVKPSVILYGGTPLGRSFAPRIAAHFKTGLTADCTKLGMKENTDLIQVRPAFGGNVMAQIICTNTRPQMATVRYKIFKTPERRVKTKYDIEYMNLDNIDMLSRIRRIALKIKEKTVDISEANIIVAVGRIFKSAEDFKMAQELADLLGGVLACSRPLVESGLMDAKRQIGLSGKTVAPKLIITLGISGSVQFVAGMNSSETIIAVNTDPNAAIFDIAHYGIVGDAFQVVPRLIEMIKGDK